MKNDFIFPCPVFKCAVCGQENMYTLIIRQFGKPIYGGSVCLHEETSLIGKEVDPRDACHFLKVEKREAQKLRYETSGQQHQDIMEFIKRADQAIELMKKNSFAQRKMAA